MFIREYHKSQNVANPPLLVDTSLLLPHHFLPLPTQLEALIKLYKHKLCLNLFKTADKDMNVISMPLHLGIAPNITTVFLFTSYLTEARFGKQPLPPVLLAEDPWKCPRTTATLKHVFEDTTLLPSK